jgi:putative ABC transport system substrate-binding protein
MLTGISVDAGVELYGKRLQLLREIVPTLSNVRVLVPLTNSGICTKHLAPVKEIAAQASMSIDLVIVQGDINSEAYGRVFESMSKEGVNGLIVADGPENLTFRQVVADLAASHRLPAIYAYREPVEVGGLMAYGVDLSDVMKRLADVTTQILRGSKPSDIPFSQQTRLELVLNRRAATKLGLEFPPSVLLSADEVLE